MLARYYSSSFTRFLSVDQGDDVSAGTPQSWNKYTYVRNNPLGLTDPTGNKATDDFNQKMAAHDKESQEWGAQQNEKSDQACYQACDDPEPTTAQPAEGGGSDGSGDVQDDSYLKDFHPFSYIQENHDYFKHVGLNPDTDLLPFCDPRIMSQLLGLSRSPSLVQLWPSF